MSSGPAAGQPAGTPLPQALLAARRENAVARFAQARILAAPVFLEARDSGDWAGAAEAALVMARACGNQRESAAAMRWVHEALQAATLASRPDLVCASWVEAAREHARAEEGAAAQRAVDEVLALVSQLNSPGLLETAYSGLTAVYSELGLTCLALASGRRALEYAQLSGDIARLSMARTNFLILGGEACEQAQEPDPAAVERLLAEMLPQLQALQQEVPQLGSSLAEARLLRVQGTLAAYQGRWDEACQAFEGLTAYPGPVPPHLLCWGWIELGRVQRLLRLHQAALLSGRKAEALNPVPEAPRRWVDLQRLASIKDLIGQPQEALDLLRRAQHRRHHLVMSALDSRAATLSARLEEQTLRVENEGLRRSNATLRAGMAHAVQLAATDPLTGLLNRRGLEPIWGTLVGQGIGLCVLGMLDIDHFKRINDEHTHASGDAVLRELARLMLQELRGGDHVARYGGEEFAVLLTGPDAAAARSVFERLRRVVQAHDWSRIACGLQVTLSAGVVAVHADETFEHVVARADHLLYAAKAAGRNQVVDALDPRPGELPAVH